MPKKSEVQKLRERLRQYSNIQERKSPLGIPEFIVPENLASSIYPAFGSYRGVNAVTSGELGSTPTIIYKQNQDTPATRIHERIHAGQFLNPNQPSAAKMAEIFNKPIDQFQNGTGLFEEPAYRFEAFRPTSKYRLEDQDTANRYMDEIFRLNPETSTALEAAMPEELIRNYIRHHPRPVPRKIRIPEFR